MVRALGTKERVKHAESDSPRVGAWMLLLLLAAVCGWFSITRPLGRDFSGYQSAFFALAATEYDEHGLTRFHGYPALEEGQACVGGMDDLVRVQDEQGPALLYRNHPPTAFWLGWLGIRAAGGAFDDPERHHWAALPFLLCHLLTLCALGWWLRVELGARAAFLGCIAAASTPIALHHGALTNLENPALPAVVLALGAHSRWRSTRSSAMLSLCAAALALASCVTFAPLAFAVALAAVGRNLKAACVLLFASALPLCLHVWISGEYGSLAQRPIALLSPMLDGSLSPWSWLQAQAQHAVAALGLPWMCIVVVGVACAPRASVLAAGLGCLLYWLAFYRHTAEQQYQFQLWWLPVLACGAASIFARLPARSATRTALVLACMGAFFAWRWEAQLQHSSLPSPEASAASLRTLVPEGSVALLPTQAGKDLCFAYQSGRDLRPASHASQGIRQATGQLEFDAETKRWSLSPLTPR